MDRALVMVAATVAASVLVVAGYLWLGVGAVCVGIWLAGRGSTGPEQDGPRLFPLELRRRIFARDGGRCQYCRVALHYESDCRRGGCDDCYEADHVEPWSDGGDTTLGNAAAACRACNQAKGARDVDDFLEDR